MVWQRPRARGTKSGLPIGRPPTYTKEQLHQAEEILDASPGMSLSELGRHVGMDRKTLRRKLKEKINYSVLFILHLWMKETLKKCYLIKPKLLERLMYCFIIRF